MNQKLICKVCLNTKKFYNTRNPSMISYGKTNEWSKVHLEYLEPKRLIKLQAHSSQVKRQLQSENERVNE